MERLTHYETPEKHAYVDRGLVSLGWYSMTDEGFRGPAIDRLAAYEDTGLCPETVAQLKEIVRIFNCAPGDPAQLKWLCNKLRDWQQAERAGRLVVLPCKVGDTVYFPVESRWDSATIEHIEVWSSGVRFF